MLTQYGRIRRATMAYAYIAWLYCTQRVVTAFHANIRTTTRNDPLLARNT